MKHKRGQEEYTYILLLCMQNETRCALESHETQERSRGILCCVLKTKQCTYVSRCVQWNYAKHKRGQEEYTVAYEAPSSSLLPIG